MTRPLVALAAFTAFVLMTTPACRDVGNDEPGRSAPPEDAEAGPQDTGGGANPLPDAGIDAGHAEPEAAGGSPIDDCADAGGANKPLVVASGSFNPGGLAVDETHAYWTTIGPPACVKCALTKDGTILRAPKCGGAAIQLASNLWDASVLALDDAFVYWLDRTDPTLGTLPRVAKVPKVGGAVSTLAVHPYDSLLGGVAVDATSAYWTLGLDDPKMSLRLRKAPNSGGTPMDLGQVDGLFFPGEVLLNSTTAFWSAGHEIYSVPLAGGPMKTVLSKGEDKIPWHMALDGSHVYWSTPWDELYRMPVAGGTPVLLSGAPASPSPVNPALAVDETFVYWADWKLGGIVKMPKVGGAFVKLADDPEGPSHATIRGARVYWSSGGGSSGDKILSVPK